MMMESIYKQQLELLLEVLPYVAEDDMFCLKGGTAINLFIRDMPRVSIDIDLVYMPVSDRKSALDQIEKSLLIIKKKIESISSTFKVSERRINKSNELICIYCVYIQAGHLFCSLYSYLWL